MEVLEDTTLYAWGLGCGNQSLRRRIYHVVDRHTTPDYQAKKDLGYYLPPLPYYMLREDLTDPPMTYARCHSADQTCNLYVRYGTGTVSSCFGGVQWGSPPATDDLMLRLRSRMQEMDWNAAMTWFERKESFKMIAKRSIQLVRALRWVRRGKFRRASDVLGITLSQRAKKRLNQRDRLDQFSENWLEFRYGFTPLLSDIYGAADYFARGSMLLKNQLIKLRTSQTTFELNGVHSLASFNPWIFDGGQDYSRVRSGAGVDYVIIDPEYRMLDAMGLKNPVSIMWELMPFSFVADWFTPIGKCIEEITAYAGLHFVGGYTYTLRQDHLSFTSASSWTGYKRILDTQFTHTRDTFVRTPFYSFSTMNVNPWKTSNGLNPKRALDAITILQRVLRGYAT